MIEKRPRHYAAEILALKTKAERREYLEKYVPEKYRRMVKGYVVNHFALMSYRRKKIEERKERFRRLMK